MNIFRRLDPQMRQSITFDNDTAFARHGWLREALDMATCFCDACASWQKGGVENANGRLRRWLPRQTNLDDVSEEDMAEIVMTCNLTPRKCPGYRTPLQALFSELGRDVRIRFARTVAPRSGTQEGGYVPDQGPDREALLAFYAFPAEHWGHLRTGKPIESVFATVRHRTVRTKEALSQKTAKLMVFKLVRAAAKTWRRQNGANQLPRVIEGVTFTNGVAARDTETRAESWAEMSECASREPLHLALELRVSMSGTGNCYNAAVETFFKTIKAELLWQRSWQTRRAAEIAIFEYINGFYNPGRRHSALGWKSPLAFEAQAAKMRNRSGIRT